MSRYLVRPNTKFNTLVDLLRLRAYNQPDQRIYTFLVNGETEEVFFTYADLDRKARMIGSTLQKAGAIGKQILLLYAPGLDYIAAFFGCLYAGSLAIPAYPPRQNRPDPRFKAILADAQASVILTTQSIFTTLERQSVHMPEIKRLLTITTDTLSDNTLEEWQEPDIDGNTLAFLQYTSGSTSTPKGVMLTHSNLLYNLSLIQECFDVGPESLGVIWLPPYHDMGLIGGILQPLYSDLPVVLMAPIAFLQRPLRWLQAISRYRATSSGGPNFAYDLCARKVKPEQLSSLDLSSWTVAFNGAEPIRSETIEHFSTTFASAGFRREAFYPCYGLAEATLIVSGGRKSDPPVLHAVERNALHLNQAITTSDDNAHILVGCGQVLRDQQIAIVDPTTRNRCTANNIGEIWIAGPSVAQGYWQRPKETHDSFQAEIADTGEGPFLRTGDLGFLKNGELFVTGRLKDLIIIRGRNYYPQDIEQTVKQSHIILRSGNCAAFSIDEDGEGYLVVVQEMERLYRHVNVDEVIGAIRQAVTNDHGLQLHAVVLIRAGSIPKTSSGKIQRYACRTGFLERSLDIIHEYIFAKSTSYAEKSAISVEAILALEEDKRPKALADYIQHIVTQHVGSSLPLLSVEQPLSTLGIDSLTATELKSHIENDLNIDLPITLFLDGGNIVQITAQLLEHMHSPQPQEMIALRPNVSDEPLPLTFEQERIWFLHRIKPGNTAYNIPCAIRLSGQLNVPLLKASLNQIIQRHEALRTSFTLLNSKPVSIIAKHCSIELLVVDLQNWPPAERESQVQLVASTEARRSFNLSQPPLIRATLIQTGPSEAILVLITHHIISDIVSIAIVLREVASLYQASLSATSSLLPDPACQYSDFVAWQQRRLQRTKLTDHIVYWMQLFSVPPPGLALPLDRPRPATRSYQGAHKLFHIPSTLFASLQKLSHQEGATLFMTLLTAWKILLYCCTQQEKILVCFPVSGRTRPEIENSIGFFAHPLLLYTDLSGDPSFRELLARVRERALQAYAHQDVPFAKLVNLARPRQDRHALPLYPVMFSYIKDPLSGIAFPELTTSLFYIEKTSIDFDLFLTIVEEEQELHGWLGYNTDIFDAPKIEQFIDTYLAILEQSMHEPSTRISRFQWSTTHTSIQEQPPTIAIAATFTAEPVMDALKFWMKKLDWFYQLDLSMYNQVFHQLLDPSSLFASNRQGVNVVLVRFEDLHQSEEDDPGKKTPLATVKIEQHIHHLIHALKAATQRAAAPYIVCLCPASPQLADNPLYHNFLMRMEALMESELRACSNIYLVTPAELMARYPVTSYYDALSDKLGVIPYTPLFFTSLGTMIARRIYALHMTVYKVIVLDCDQVLWKGIIGEDGVQGIKLDAPYKLLQEFMVTQYNAGMLICLCSKNNEADVVEAFEHFINMPLKRHHIVSWRINWQSKSANIQSLANELQLGLDSFIFLDDNPVEIADVQAHCPEVLALLLPAEAEKIPSFLQHVWAFDHLKSTEEDQLRTSFYKENSERQQFQQQAPTFEDFLAGLDLQVQISELLPHQISRVAQLTQRTNQFNCTTLRFSENEIQQLHQTKDKQECLIVKCSDRFGEYGLVGVLIFTIIAETMKVDVFLLSCRALGKGVEHQMLAALGKTALARGFGSVEIPYIPTKKNQPALDFLNIVGGEFKSPRGDGWVFKLPANLAASTTFLHENTASHSSNDHKFLSISGSDTVPFIR